MLVSEFISDQNGKLCQLYDCKYIFHPCYKHLFLHFDFLSHHLPCLLVFERDLCSCIESKSHIQVLVLFKCSKQIVVGDSLEVQVSRSQIILATWKMEIFGDPSLSFLLFFKLVIGIHVNTAKPRND